MREFQYSESKDLGRGRHQQVIILDGKLIGFLLSIEKNFLCPIEEKYLLPDLDYGVDGMEDGWIDFKVFTDYNEAFNYAIDNFERINFLFLNGNYD